MNTVEQAFHALNSFRFWKVPFLLVVWATAVFGNARARRFLLLLGIVLLINDGLVANRLKEMVARPRPPGAQGASTGSFPSGHALNVFSAATLATAYYGPGAAWAYVPAALVAVGRVVEGKHYPSDVAAGALLGILLTLGEYVAARRIWRRGVRPAWRRWLDRTPAEKRWTIAAVALLAGLTLFRVGYVAAGVYPLAPDEAYYWTWSQRPALSYYSKGPGIAVQIAATTAMLGDTELGVRAGPVLLSALIGFLLWRETRRRRGAVEAFFVLLTLALVPLFSAGAVLATIDAPLLACWTAAVLLYARAAERPSRAALWIGLGIVLGIGFLAKFSILLLAVGLLIHAATSGGFRRPEVRRGFAWTGAVFLPFVVPLVAWNHAVGWPTFRHLWERGGLDTPARLRLDMTLEFLGTQAGIVSPILWVMLLWGGWRMFRRPPGEDRAEAPSDPWFRILGWAAVPTAVFYAVLSLRSRIQPNWLAPVYLSLTPLATAWCVTACREIPRRRHALVVAARAALALAFVMTLVVYRGDLLWRVGYAPPARWLPQQRLLGWRELGRHVDRARERLPDPSNAFVLGTRYQIAGELAFYCKGHPPADTTAPEAGDSQFDFWPGIEAHPGADAILVAGDAERERADAIRKSWFADSEEFAPFDITFRGQHAGQYLVFVCRGYRGGATGRSSP